MQQMHEPSRRSYGEEDQIDPGYPVYRSRQFSEEYGEERELPGYRDREQEQQKLQPITRLERIQRAIAIVFMAITPPMLGFSIALFVLAAVNLASTSDLVLPPDAFERIVASFVIALIMMLFVITAFIFSIIQLTLIENKFRKRGGGKER